MNMQEKLQYINRLQILGESDEVIITKLMGYDDDVIMEFLLLPEVKNPRDGVFVVQKYVDLLAHLDEGSYQVYTQKYKDLYG